MNYRDPNLRESLANDYVLGTLRYGAARRFEQLMRQDESLRDLVSKIQMELAPMIELLPPEKPDDAVWARIEQQLFIKSSAASQSVDTPLKASNDWQNTFFKAWAAVASIALILVVWQPWSSSQLEQVNPQVADVEIPQEPIQEPIIEAPAVDPIPAIAAVLNNAESQQAAWLLTLSEDRKQLVVNALNPQLIDAERVFELWIKLAQADSVQSIGVIPADGKYVIPITEKLAQSLEDTEFFAVSVEPLGGSPTGQPTTAPTHIGTIVQI